MSRLRQLVAGELSPEAYSRLTGFAVVALVAIVVTGGAVRLTGSGLGCPDWPTCQEGRIVPPVALHPMVEFVNRLFTGVVSAAIAGAVLGAHRRRPRRTDLVVLAWGLVAGVVAQIILGRFTVTFDLWPPLVMAHFLLSMAMIADAVVLHERAGGPAPAADRRVVGPTRWLVGWAAVVVFTGTVVTAAGPHGGDERARRLAVPLTEAARVHGISVLILCAILAVAVIRARRAGAGPLTRRLAVLAGVVAAQAGVGWTQWFLGVPALLVGIHLLGAALVWVATLRVALAVSTPGVAPAPGVPGTPPAVAAGTLR